MTNYNVKIDFKMIKNILTVKHLDKLSPKYDLIKNNFKEKKYLKCGSSLENDFNAFSTMWNERERFEFSLDNIFFIEKQFNFSKGIDIYEANLLLNLIKNINRNEFKKQIIEIFTIGLERDIFFEYTYETIIILINIRLFQLNITPLVFNNYSTKLKLAVKAGIKLVVLGIFEKVYLYNKKLNKKNEVPDMKKTKTIILSHKNLLKKVYCCENIWIFGSVVDGTGNEYSDIDLLVNGVFEVEEMLDVEKFLERKLKCKVDVISYNNVKRSTFYREIKNKMVKIF